MFNEDDDWSDEQDAQTLSTTVLRSTKKANSSTNVKSHVVGKKSLMRTLQTLGSVPEWKNDDHQQDSDSEADVVPTHSKRKKKKKRKKRKRVETTGEQQESGDLDQTTNGQALVSKKRKKEDPFVAALKLKTSSVKKTADIDIIESKPENMEGLNRQQWKNKMKNKRKCKNKFSQNEPEREINKAETAEQHEPKEEVKIDSYSNNNNNNSQTPAKKKQCKPQQIKKIKVDTRVSGPTDPQPLREEKQPIVSKVGKDTTETSAKQKAAEPRVENAAEPRVENAAEPRVENAAEPRVENAAEPRVENAAEPRVENAAEQHQSPLKRPKPEMSREQILKREKLRKLLLRQEPVQPESPAETEDPPAVPEEELKPDRSAALRSRMEQRLESARFRYINEVLYSTSSGEAKRMFRQDPQAFGIYHRGYTAQVQRWPANPVDAIISYIQQKPPSLVVADFGCGDCKIARSVKNKVHSFDLAAACKDVTICDMANVPLGNGCVDVAVFCLSLMGTNLADFLAEANRVLKKGGVLKIAEVASRFENVRNFISALAGLGFKLVNQDTKSSHFYSFELLKTGDAPENIKKFGLQLRPCLYKKR